MGRRLMSFFLCGLLIVSLCGCSNDTLTLEECFSCVYSIICSSETRYDSIGSAFVVKDNKVITNAHVVSYLEDNERIVYETIIAKSYNSEQEIPLAVDIINYEKDFAVLNFINEKDRANKYLQIGKSSDLKIGESLVTIGNLNNYGLCCNSGILSSYKKKILNNNVYNEYYQTDIEISKGSSGGPVLNEENNVVGIMAFKVRDTNAEYVDGMSFFIPIEVVME